MKKIPDFCAFFVQDLFKRAESTLKKCAEEDFKNLIEFNVRNLRKVMDGAPFLDPFNLLFIKDQLFKLGYIDETDLPVTLKSIFDILLGYTMVFR